jgi:hypothetical protein
MGMRVATPTARLGPQATQVAREDPHVSDVTDDAEAKRACVSSRRAAYGSYRGLALRFELVAGVPGGHRVPVGDAHAGDEGS